MFTEQKWYLKFFYNTVYRKNLPEELTILKHYGQKEDKNKC